MKPARGTLHTPLKGVGVAKPVPLIDLRQVKATGVDRNFRSRTAAAPVGWLPLMTKRPGRPEDLPRDVLGLSNRPGRSVDGVCESCAVPAAETEGCRPCHIRRHGGRTKWDGVKGRSGCPVERARIDARSCLICGYREPQRGAVAVVSEPRREYHVSLVRQINAPTRFGSWRIIPPQVLHVRGKVEVGLRKAADRQNAKHFASY